jgi:hypothetical protein
LKSNEALRAVINSGHGKDGAVYRAAGENFEPKRFSTFAPVAIALIGNVADTIKDRSICIRMRRRRHDEIVERLRLDRPDLFENLRRRCMRWAIDHMNALASADPDIPPSLNDRAADNWRPLLAIADEVGGEWPTKARTAAMLLSIEDEDDESSARTMLLMDIRHLFEGQDRDKLDAEWFGRITSGDLCEKLSALEDRPWEEWHKGKPITPRDLAYLLKSFEIRPKDIKLRRGLTRKGYDIEDFKDAFERYLPALSNGKSKADATDRETNNNSSFSSAAPSGNADHKNADDANDYNAVADEAVQEASEGGEKQSEEPRAEPDKQDSDDVAMAKEKLEPLRRRARGTKRDETAAAGGDQQP